MILKVDIETTYQFQKQVIQHSYATVVRDYIADISITGKHIEVISGIRRCGKSTLMLQIMNNNYKKVAYFNFEDSRIFGFELSDFSKLDEIIEDGIEAYFFDEIQNVPNWEVFIRQLHERGDKVFITGSNASLLSKELGTRLTGRYVNHELFPFSFKEYLSFLNSTNPILEIENYINHGGFPEYLNSRKPEILQNLLKDIVYRDIAVRYGIRNIKSLMDITLYLLSNIGKEFSYNSLAKLLSIGSANTISDYLTWLEDSYIFFYLPKFSWSAKKISVNPRKLYAIDNGMVNANSLSFSKDNGRLFENAVYLYLRKKYERIFYFREKGECDFVVFDKDKCVLAIQVCESVHSENKNREIKGLQEAMDFFKLDIGFVITKNQDDLIKIDNRSIFIKPAFDFFYKNNILNNSVQ